MLAGKRINILTNTSSKYIVIILIGLLITQALSAQIIKGTITATDGFGIDDVTVILTYPDGTKDTTKTDSNGNFTIGKTTTVGIDKTTNNKGLYYRLSGNELYLKYDAAIKEGFVYDISGKTNTWFQFNNATEGTIRLKNTSKSIYFLEINTADGIKTAKIIKLNDYGPIHGISTNKTNTKNKRIKDSGNHQLSAAKEDYKTQEIQLTNLDETQTYDNNNFELHNTDKTFNQLIISGNEKGENIDVNYEIIDANTDEVLTTGNTGANGLDTLQVVKEYPANTELEVTINTTSNNPEINPASITNFWGQETLQENRTTNDTKRYDYTVNISANDAENANPLTGFTASIYIDDIETATENSGTNTSIGLSLNQYPNNTTIQIITTKTGYENDTTEITLLKTELSPQVNTTLNPILYNFSINISANDAENANPLTGFNTTIYIDGAETATGNSGTSTFIDLEANQYPNNTTIQIISTKTGYQNDTIVKTLIKANLNPHFTSTLTFINEFWLTGNVTPTNNVTVKGWENGEMLIDTTVNNGKYTTKKLNKEPENGLDSIKFEATGYTPEKFYNVALTANEATTQNATLEEIIIPPEDTYSIVWHKGVDELAQSGTTFDVTITAPNHTKTFTVSNETWYRDTIPTQEGVAVNATIEYTPHVQGGIPLYPKTVNITIPEGTTHEDRDTIKSLEQNVKYDLIVYDFENQTSTKEANILLQDLQGNTIFQGTTTNGRITTPYLATGKEGTGFEGAMTITPIDGNYLGTRWVINDSDDWNGQDQLDLFNNLGIKYKGYEEKMPEIQKDFSRTKEGAFYIVKKMRADPLTGTMLDMNPSEINEMEANEINTELARYQSINVYFIETDPGFNSYIEHTKQIFGYDFNVNEVNTERNTTSQINDYSIDNDNYKSYLGWNVEFGDNSTNGVATNPLLFGKIDISARGIWGLDLTNIAGAEREFGRITGMGTVWSRESYMSTSLPPNFPDDLNIKDRTITNLILKYRETQVKQEPAERNLTNAGYFFTQ